MRRPPGFTLIEVMIVIAIIAILSAIAIPAYSEYVIRSRLTGGIAGLSSMRVKMEQYFQDNRKYTDACAAPPIGIVTPTDSNFDFTGCSTPTDSTYLLTATGTGTLTGIKYTVDQANVRATTGVLPGWAGLNAACWVLKKDGSC